MSPSGDNFHPPRASGKPWQDIVAVITGGASGIARSLSLSLAKEAGGHDADPGVRIVIADLDERGAQAVAAELEALGAEALAVRCDVSLEPDVERLAATTRDHFGGVNLLCNVTGVHRPQKLHETSAADVEWMFSVNVFGLCHMVRHFVPLLHAAAQNAELAHVINVSSGFGLAVPPMGGGYTSAYAGTKHAIVGLSDAMRKDLADDGIGVSVVCPGVVNTQTWNSLSFRQERFGGPIHGTPESKAAVENYGQDPDEVAAMIMKAVKAGDFFILPLTDWARKSMGSEIEARYQELDAALNR